MSYIPSYKLKEQFVIVWMPKIRLKKKSPPTDQPTDQPTDRPTNRPTNRWTE